MKVKKDFFLTKNLKYEVYNISNIDNFKINKSKNTRLYCCNLLTSDYEKINIILTNKFRLVTTNLIFELDKKKLPLKKNTIQFRLVKKSDRNRVLELSRSFNNDRFHSDIEISKNIADKIKFQWTNNFFEKKRGDFMIVAEKNNFIIGYMILLKKKNNIVIDLIAIDKKFRKKGYGEELISSILKFKKIKYNKIIVGTQVTNTSSIKLYTKLNFRLIKSYYSFHLHC